MAKFLRLVFLLYLFALHGQTFAGSLSEAKEAYYEGNYAKAAELFMPLAMQGDANAQFNLGLMYAKGQGLQHDDKLAASWYLKAALQNNPMAQFAIAEMYRDGLVVRESKEQDVMELLTIGIYQSGLSVTESNKQSVMWFLKAANNRLQKAQYAVGMLYAKGELGLSQDYVQAYMWLNLSGYMGINSLKWVEGKMTTEQIEKAKMLVHQWQIINEH